MSITNLELIKTYIDATKTFIQLSGAGLVLPLTIHTQILGLFHGRGPFAGTGLLLVCASWLCFLVAIGGGALYQYAAVKFVEVQDDPVGTYVSPLLEYLVRREGPGLAYGVMVGAFFGGAILVVLYSSASLFGA